MAKKPYPSEMADRFQIRMPDGLRERIAAAAEANKRSMNSEIVDRLEASFETEAAIPDEGQPPQVHLKWLLDLRRDINKAVQEVREEVRALRPAAPHSEKR